ncbi:BZIP transcription factor family protein putative isoform 1 [Tripterygium wilfordii]|uniref:BZIP transcription factor family protein putative isoform 1 n=2 Tax=Tripterygium wilfordii TaxID=458696 RepID=A0A7J7D6C2_TRIWF|nr:BZIP transcription factor family protein putative isoform 1 [Tripterygium wilfordii]
MNRLFSVGDLSDPFWNSTAPEMHRIDSEWAFERLLEEVAPPSLQLSNNDAVAPPSSGAQPSKPAEGNNDGVIEIDTTSAPARPPAPLDHALEAPRDSDEYRAYLQSKLEIACATVARSRAASMKPEGFSTSPENQVQATESSRPESQANGTGHVLMTEQCKANDRPMGVAALPALQKKLEVLPAQATSGSSREDSDDDEFEGEIEINENMDPADAKRARRMLSNRESARRSRRRKQDQMNELETQAGQLKDKHSSLQKHLTEINQKCDKASVDNRILKADIETLRAKVKMAEAAVKQMTGVNPRLLTMSGLPGAGMPFISSPVHTSRNFVQMPPNPNEFLHQPVPNVSNTILHDPKLYPGFNQHHPGPPVGNPHNVGANNVCLVPPVQPLANEENVIGMPFVHQGAVVDQVHKHIIGPSVSDMASPHPTSIATDKNQN